MATSSFIYTPSYVYPVTPIYKTQVSEFEDGTEERVDMWSTAKRAWRLQFKNIDKTTRDAIEALFVEKKGRLTTFHWTCLDDSTQYTVRFNQDSLPFARTHVSRYDVEIELITANT